MAEEVVSLFDKSTTELFAGTEKPQAESAASTAAAEPKLYAGKYKTPEELEKGYRNSAEETAKIIAREKAKDQVIAELKMALQGRVNPAEVATSRKNPREELTEAMVPVEALGAFVREAIAEEFKPIALHAQAHASLSRTYEDFKDSSVEQDAYLAANPEFAARYQRMLQTDPDVAMEILYHRAKGGRAADTVNDLSGQEQATNRAVAALTSTTTGPRGTESTYEARLAAAKAHLAATGDEGPYLRIRLVESGVIPAEMVENLQR